MRCGKAQRMISARLDGELDEARDKAVGKHLAGCARCRAFAADVTRFTEDFDSLTVPEPRWGFTGRLMARLSEQESSSNVPWSWVDLLRPAPLGLGAAAFSLGIVLTVLVNGELPANGEDGRRTVEALVGDYWDALSEVSVDEQLLALLPETEE